MGYGQAKPKGLVEADISAHGKAVLYRQAGDGPDLVLLHGSGKGDGRGWFFSAFARLAENHRVVCRFLSCPVRPWWKTMAGCWCRSSSCKGIRMPSSPMTAGPRGLRGNCPGPI